MRDSSDLPKSAMLLIALVQGLSLFALYRAFEVDAWPSAAPLWSFPLWTLALAVPLLLLLAIDRSNRAAVVGHVAAFGALLALLAVYTGWQAEPDDAFPVHSLVFAFAASISLACFKALMYMQQRAERVTLTYPVLFTNSWRNFLVGALAALFVVALWLILLLWGRLFEVIDIDFFSELFREDWFLFPVLSVALGVGVIMFRGLTGVIDNIARLLHWLIKLLLPLVVLVAVIFLAALPLVGLEALWSTGTGTALLLWLLALMLFFVNAVYQDGRESAPYPRVIHRIIFVGLCVMPIVSALSLYGLTLRLQQYGWSVERCWAMVVWLILTLFALGYVYGILRRRDAWTGELARVNIGMGLVVLAIMLLANSPLLDFRKISLASQLARVESGEVELRDFDFWYARNHLARPGFLAMERFKRDVAASDAVLLALIEEPRRRSHAVTPAAVEDFWANVTYRPEPFDVPRALKSKLEFESGEVGGQESILVQIDLDADGCDEYVLLALNKFGVRIARYYYLANGAWHAGMLRQAAWAHEDNVPTLLKNGEIRLITPRFGNLDIGGIVFQPQDDDPGQ